MSDYNRVALIGLGLIASSLAHAMRRAGLKAEIIGTARSEDCLLYTSPSPRDS